MNFQKTIQVKTTKENAFDAITTGINKWWGNVDNSYIRALGDEFSIFFEEETQWRFTITKLEKYAAVIWQCIYADHTFSGLKGIKEEWLNTEIIFNFKELDANTIELYFEHKGLTPALNCYQICDAGWTHFIVTSLKQYLETGKGSPNLIEPPTHQ